jgi:hypothetical protein
MAGRFFRFVMGTVYSAAMATAKQRSTKSSAAGSKAADKTASSTASRPGTRGTPPKKGGRPASQKQATPAGKAGQSRIATPLGTGGKAAPRAPKATKAARQAGTPGDAAPKGSKGAAPKATRTAAPKAARNAASKGSKGAAPKAAGARAGKAGRRAGGAKGSSTPQTAGDAALFAPLTDGERAETLRLLTEDARLAAMANVGRYRVIAVEPLAVKSPADLSSHRLARAVVYDYSSERSVDACIDLDTGKVIHLTVARTQPMLSREEENTAIAIAFADEQVKSKLAPGDGPQVAMHYWSHSDASLAYSRRAAAVLLGQPGGATSLIAVVDLLDNLVCEIVPAAEW